MKTNFITLLFAFFGLSTLQAQSLVPQYEDNNLLVHFHENMTQDRIDLIRNGLDATELWMSPLSNARYWYMPLNGDTVVIDGVTIELNSITNALDGILKLSGADGDDHDDTEGVGLSYTSYTLPVQVSPSAFTPLTCTDVLDLYAKPGNSQVRIAINDSGYNQGLTGTLELPYDPTIGNITDYLPGGNQGVDNNGHGTHVLGVASHITNHELNSANGQFSFDVNRILDESGQGNLANLIYSVENAIVAGSQIINLSLGLISNYEENSFLKRMIRQVELRNALLIVAAGNNGLSLNENKYILPASMQSPNIITVGSSRCLDGISEFSNYGINSVDIMAPGEDIIGFDHNSNMVVMTGTSQATAIVTGIAALVASYQLEFDAPAVKCAILEGSNHTPNLNGTTINSSAVDADGAIDALRSNGCGISFNLTERSRDITNPPIKTPSIKTSSNPFQNELNIGNNENSRGVTISSLKISPNPFSNELNLVSNENVSHVIVSDLLGKVVFSKTFKTGQTQLKIDTNNFQTGIYIATVIKENKTKETVRLIKS